MSVVRALCCRVTVSLAASSSWAALTVTVCAALQLEELKVRLVGLTLTSPPAVMSTVTSAVGTTSSAIV